jgi:putative transposase
MSNSSTIHKAFQFKLDATPEQEQRFRQHAGSVRWVYNHMLAQRKDAFKARAKSPTTLSR